MHKEPKILGSSVLIQIKDYTFLISAAHVLKDFTKNNHLYIPCSNDFYPLNGYLSLVDHTQNTNDISLFILSNDFGKLIINT